MLTPIFLMELFLFFDASRLLIVVIFSTMLNGVVSTIGITSSKNPGLIPASYNCYSRCILVKKLGNTITWVSDLVLPSYKALVKDRILAVRNIGYYCLDI